MLNSDHVVIPVWNAAASLAFYCEVLGLALVHTVTGALGEPDPEALARAEAWIAQGSTPGGERAA